MRSLDQVAEGAHHPSLEPWTRRISGHSLGCPLAVQLCRALQKKEEDQLYLFDWIIWIIRVLGVFL